MVNGNVIVGLIALQRTGRANHRWPEMRDGVHKVESGLFSCWLFSPIGQSIWQYKKQPVLDLKGLMLCHNTTLVPIAQNKNLCHLVR